MGKMFLVIIDAHSKWLKVLSTTQATSLVTIEKLRGTFATFRLPEILVRVTMALLLQAKSFNNSPE